MYFIMIKHIRYDSKIFTNRYSQTVYSKTIFSTGYMKIISYLEEKRFLLVLLNSSYGIPKSLNFWNSRKNVSFPRQI